MSIFSSNNKQTQPKEEPQPKPSNTATPNYQHVANRAVSSTTIAQGTQIDGNVKMEGNIQIDGLVKGTLTSKGKVVIGAEGIVQGDILCQHAEISGRVNGKLKIADILFLKSSARIEGDIQTGKLVMESGVQFNGNCSMGGAASVPSTTEKSAPTANTTTGTSQTQS